MLDIANKIINGFINLTTRNRITLYLVGGQTISFRCKAFTYKYKTDTFRLCSYTVTGKGKDFPQHFVFDDVSAITSRRVLRCSVLR